MTTQATLVEPPQQATSNGSGGSGISPSVDVKIREQTTSYQQPQRTVPRKLSVGDRITSAISSAYNRLGSSVGRRPWLFIAGALLVTIFCAAGMSRFKNENRPDKLWVPASSQAQDDKRFVDSYFEEGFRIVAVQVIADNGSALTPEALNYLGSLSEQTQSIAVSAKDYDGAEQIVTYESRCLRFGPNCYQQSLLEVFNGPEEYDTTEEILSKVNEANLETTEGFPITPGDVIGGITRDSSGSIEDAKAVRFVKLFKYEPVEVSGDEKDPLGDAWEEEWLNWAEAEAKRLQDQGSNLRISYFATRSFADEFGAVIDNDVTLIQAAVVIIFVYAFVMLSDWTKGCLKTRGYVTLSSLLTIGLAVLSSFGLCSWAGLFYSPLMSVFPILLLGIGVDDSFIITNDFDLTDPSLSIPQRMGKTLSMAGSSITVTSLTDFAAFIIGSNTSLPALRNFSIYAAIGILFTLAYSVTFFSANLTLDARRQEANRKDCLCCVTSSADPESLGPNVLCRCGTPCGKDPLWMHAVMRKTGEVLASRAGKVASIVVFSAIFIGGVAGIAQIKIQSDNNNFVPPDSYLDTYITDSEALFTSTGENIGVFAGELEYNTPQVQSLMEDLFESVKADPYAATDTLDAWWPAFRDVPTSAACTANASAVTASGRTQGDLCGDVALTSPTDDAFAVKLDRFVNGSEYGFLGGSRFSSDVVFKNDDPAQGIEATRIVRGLMVFLDDSQEQVRAMDSLRDTVADTLKENEMEDSRVFVYSGAFLNYEQFKAVRNEFVLNVSLAMLMVVVIVFILLGNLIASSITSGMLILVIVEIIGYLHFWSIEIDAVVVIMFVIALGLSVDYSVHIAHGYMTRTGTADERLIGALEEVGTGVVNGGLSTWLAVLLLGASNSYVFVVFFRALFLCTTLGIANGLLFLPVLLSLANPKPHSHADESEAAHSDGKGGKGDREPTVTA